MWSEGRLVNELICCEGGPGMTYTAGQGTPDGEGLALQNREKYLLPFLSLQIMDFLLCLLTLLGSYIELPAYLKFASRSRAVSMQPCTVLASRAQAQAGGRWPIMGKHLPAAGVLGRVAGGPQTGPDSHSAHTLPTSHL